ncbi:MAG: EF-hand domain-containing protein [Phycisphaeraceae bacterium]|nr:MAG: EF-hand domain-containing protein [Phycisphaeraceae bacterium]
MLKQIGLAVGAILASAGGALAQTPSNACASAPQVGPGTYAGTTASATNDGQTSCGNSNSSRDVWLKYVASNNVELVVETCGLAGWDTVLSLHSGCPGSQGNTLACNDDSCSLQSRVSRSLISGETVYIRIGGFGSANGAFSVTVREEEPPPPPTLGPDVIVGELLGWGRYSAIGGITSFAIGTESCNVGDAPIQWIANTNEHPVIAQNLYRIKDGVFTHVGMSWVKHGFSSVNGTTCGPCTQPPGGSSQLGVGCSDPYGSGLNGSQGGLGPRSQVNATTGVFQYPPTAPGVTNELSRRLQVNTADITPAQNVGAIYLSESQYVTRDDALWNNALNNASYRRTTIASATATPAYSGPTVRRKTAIEGWRDIDPTVTLVPVEYDDGGILVRFWVGAKVINNGDGTWTYVYAVHNLNSDRSGQRFTLPRNPGVVISQNTFHAPFSHSGEPYSNAAWAYTEGGNSIEWSTQTFAQNANANAIRWGTAYTFTIRANTGPETGTASLGLFKPGTPTSLAVQLPVPAGIPCGPDFNGDGFLDFFDLDAFVECFEGVACPPGRDADYNGDGFIDFFDADAFVEDFEAGC